MTAISDISAHMIRSLAIVALLTALSMVAAIAMLPNTEEKVAVLAAHQRYDEAIALVENRRARAGLTPYEVFTLAGMYRITHQPGPAISLLESEASTRPDDGWTLGLLAALYRDTGDAANEARILRRVFLMEPTAQTYRRLIVLLRMAGDREAEREVIAQAQAAGLTGPADDERLLRLREPGVPRGAATVWRATDVNGTTGTTSTLAAME